MEVELTWIGLDYFQLFYIPCVKKYVFTKGDEKKVKILASSDFIYGEFWNRESKYILNRFKML